MIRAGLRAAAVALLASPCAADSLVVRADQVHVGDGTVLRDAAIVVDGATIAWIGSLSELVVPAGAREVSARHLLPGLVTTLRAGNLPDPGSADATRRAADLALPADDAALLDRGVTAIRACPGVNRLVAGRGALLQPEPDGARRVLLELGAVHASLGPEALAPPPAFEPVLRVNADNPLPPARLQRPFTAMAAAGELRRLIGSDDAPWPAVHGGSVPLAIHARTEAEIRRALDLAAGSSARLVIEGGDESSGLPAELARAGVLVVLDPADPAEALARDVTFEPGTAATLHAAGVRVALADPERRSQDPLLLAAWAVRHGLPREAAIAAITGLSWAAEGQDARRIREGMPADLAAFDDDPLLARATPALVVSGGRVVREARRAELETDDEPLALRVGRAIDGDRVIQPATILLRAGRIASVMAGEAAPAGVPLLDLGSGSVAVPGFIDAFSRAGLDPGASPGGSPRVRATEALEPGHASLAAALEAGVTAALAVPATRGAVLGMAGTIGLLSREELPPHDADRPEPPAGSGRPIVDVLSADAGIVLWADDGPADDAPRQARLKALRETLQKAKAYHESWSRAEKKPDDEQRPRNAKEDEKPEKDPALEPWRPVFAGKAKAWLRCGREDLIVPALDALKSAGIASPVLCGAEEADLAASEIASRGLTVVLAPATTRRQDGEEISVAVKLREAGVPVAFGSFTPGAASELPLQAAELVRAGLSPQDALAGLTTVAASASGLPAPAGRLVAGARGDVVVFEGDPMEPSSPVKLVVARGRVAWRAP